MSELKKNFVQGKMNKDYDVRLIPEGEYIDAFNVLVSNSEGSQVGSVQNSYGLDKLSDIDLSSDAETIGSVTDEGNECIYWFVASSEGSYIYEYDQLNNGGTVSVVLEDTRTANNVLNFKKEYKITGANVIYNSFNNEKLLVWTDDINPIRCININRAKGYGPSSPSLFTFFNKDISLYKIQPHFPPICTPTIYGSGLENNIKERFLSFGYRWKYLDGEYSAISTFSNPQFYPGKFQINFQTNENLGMVNKFNAVNIKFDTGDKNVTDVQVLFKESNSNTIWIIDTFNKVKSGWTSNVNQSYTFSNNQIYSVLPEDEVNRLFDNVPIKAKSQDFIGNRLIYGNYVEGRDLKDSSGVPITIDYKLSSVNNPLSSARLPANSISNTVTTTDTTPVTSTIFNVIELDFTNSPIKSGEVLGLNFRATSPVTPYNYGGNYIFSLFMYVDSNYTNAAALQVAPEFTNFINIASSNFKNYLTGSNAPTGEDPLYAGKYKPFEVLPSISVNKIRIKIPYIEYKVGTVYRQEYFSIFDGSLYVNLSNGNAYSSVKSNRSYEVGIVYLDNEGRYSTVITNAKQTGTNNHFIPITYSKTKNTLKLEIKHKAPSWATKYKIFVKDNKLDYQTIYGLVQYKEENNLWIKLEGQDKDKVAQGDFLILKKNLNGPLDILEKIEVLEYKQQPSNFIEGGSAEVAGNYIKVRNAGGISNESSANDILSFQEISDGETSGVAGVRLTPAFSTLNATTGLYEDFPIRAGSKIDIYAYNFLGDLSEQTTHSKSYTVGDDYLNFQSWFQSEAGGLGPFGYNFLRFRIEVLYYLGQPYNHFIQDPNGALFMEAYGIHAGDGGTYSRMNFRITITSAAKLLILETEPKDKVSQVYYETPDTYLITNGYHTSKGISNGDQDQTFNKNAILNLSFFNCYTQGNGAESYRVRDLFSSNFLSANTRPNAVLLDEYKERRNISSLTYSGGYNKTTSYNSLNEFNLSRANYKDLDDKYGSIQKIFSRDTDLIVFQEDKVHKVLYNKNLLSDAVGGGQITSVENVLGQEIPFSGEYGIGLDPESFANFANNIYFTDQRRGSVLRLGSDGLEPISRYGMRDWFRDNLRENKGKFFAGGYDPSYDNYMFSITGESREVFIPLVVPDQEIRKLRILKTNSYNYQVNAGKKIGDFVINYTCDGDLDIQASFDGDTYAGATRSGTGNFSFVKNTTEEIVLISIRNNSSTEDVVISLSNTIPQTPQLEVVSLVVNDLSDVDKSMRNRYTWTDSVYGFSGESSNDDVFEASGLTRFETIVGNESDAGIPLQGSTIRVYSDNLSGSFTYCNKIGYTITNETLDAQEIRDRAIYPSIITEEDSRFIEFVFDRDGDLNAKLYMVWDYIDDVSATVKNRLYYINQKESFTFNALDNVFVNSPYTITIDTYPALGEVEVVGDFITYLSTGNDYLPDYFDFVVASGVCSELIRVDITMRKFVDCREFEANWGDYGDPGQIETVNYIDCDGAKKYISVDATTPTATFCGTSIEPSLVPTALTTNLGSCNQAYYKQYKIYSSDGVNSCLYVDIANTVQTISVDGTSGYVEDFFCARTIIELPRNVVKVGNCP